MFLKQKTIDEITNRYYSCFCGVDLSTLAPGVHFVCTQARDAELKGFGCKYTVYILEKNEVCVISYAPKYRAFLENLKGRNAGEIIAQIRQAYPLHEMRLMTFEKETVTQYGSARILQEADYPLFETFFCETTPEADPEGWLRDYFIQKASMERMVGYSVNGRLLSVCDAPDMPYMEDQIQHTGIKTVKEARRNGYGRRTAAMATHHLLENGICPQWECDARNAASFALAKSIGYREFGTAYILEED